MEQAEEMEGNRPSLGNFQTKVKQQIDDMKKKIDAINSKHKDENKEKLYENIQQCQGILDDFDEDDKFMERLKAQIQSLKDSKI